MKKLWELVTTFFKIGILTFGGGYAMLPMLQREVVEKHKWATEEELLNYFAVGQCTPGVIAVNTATFVGYYQKGVLGGIVATVGVVLPSLIIITVIAMVLSNFAHIEVVQHAFGGIRIAVGAMIASSVINLIRKNVKNWFQIVLCVVAFVIVAVLGQSPVYVVIGAGLAGFIAGRIGKCQKS